MNPPYSIAEILNHLTARRHLSDEQVHWIITELVAGRCSESAAADFLLVLFFKQETAYEIAAATRVLREHGCAGIRVRCSIPAHRRRHRHLYISTATALVAAALAHTVVTWQPPCRANRHADVLTSLGVKIGDAEFARQCVREANFAFCFAPHFHPALKNVAGVRRALGVPTIFNCLGPLANPAGATRQLIGVGRIELLDLLGQALTHLGTQHALVICSADGLDEVSLSAPTFVREVRDGEVVCQEWTAADFGLESCSLAELSAPHADASADIIKGVIKGSAGAPTRIVLANTAAALLVAGVAKSLLDGVERAREAIRSGNALRVLQTLQRLSA